jgi:hypothetical protein
MTSTEKATTEVTQRDVLTVRLPTELHEELRAYKLFAGRPINDVVVGLIREFLAGPGGDEIARGMTARAKSMYGEALDKLAEM